MLKRYLECGKIVSTHGVKGELKVQPWCDSAEFLLGFKTLYLESGKSALKVKSARIHKGMALLTFYGTESIDDAMKLRGKTLYIDREDAPPEDGRYYFQDLLGIGVEDADTGAFYGKITDIIETGANDVYEITGLGGKKLIPAIPDVIVDTDAPGGKMRIRPLEGLFDDEN